MFLTCPVFFPSRSPASQQKPQRGCKTLFGTLVVLHPKSASRRRVPVVTANVTSPHAFVCFYTLFIAFFFPLYLSLPRISRSDLWTRASTNAQLVYGHHGTDLFVGGILLLRVWTAQMGILMFLLLCEALFYLRSLRSVRNQAKLMWRKYFFKVLVLNSEF